MPSNTVMKFNRQKIIRFILICLFFLWVNLFIPLMSPVSSEVLDRVVAVVNDEVILLTELKNEISARKKHGSGLTAAGVLDDMINRLILLDEARKFMLNITAVDIDSAIDLYIERRIKAMIHIPFEDMESYYIDHRGLYGDKEFYDVKDEIESFLLEKELKIRLLKQTKELRSKSYIRIQIEDSD
jgi:hypothetical protein